MTSRSLHDGQVLFDVPLDAAERRIADLRGTAVTSRDGPLGRSRFTRPRIRHALGVRLLQLGGALLADEALVRGR